MPTKLYVGNVPRSMSSTDLKELFEKYGKVLECDIVKDYAFVVSAMKTWENKKKMNLILSSIWKIRAKQKHQ